MTHLVQFPSVRVALGLNVPDIALNFHKLFLERIQDLQEFVPLLRHRIQLVSVLQVHLLDYKYNLID